MALGTGTRLGRYEILEPIGAGGMGAVYRARDTSLWREVAIKVLLDEFTADTDRVRRFEREAKATAALNHPNLLAVYDVGTHEGLTYLVSELLQGRTLRDVLAAGPMPPRRAARFAAQIADGLAAAHAKGVVHRDLKPANLFVTPDDRIKILDFGLARVVATSPLDDATSRSTETSLTTVGTVLGSAGYMAPEQVRGAAIDHRADIFSLGCVLYEMLAGRRAFHRDTVAGTLAAIVESEPPTSSGDGSIASQRLMRITRRCLEKNPEQRFQSARDLVHVLVDESAEESGALGGPSRAPQPWKTIALATATLAVVMTAFGVWAWKGRDTSDKSAGLPTIAFDLALPGGLRLVGRPVLSPDGKQIAFVATRDRQNGLYLRKLSDRQARLLPGTEGVGDEGAKQPFFSPRGDRLAFFASGNLKITPIDGGTPSVLCPAPEARGGAWGDDDQIVFAAGPGTGLSRVRASGGNPELLTTLGSDEQSHRWPVAVPGSAGLIFVLQPRKGPTSIVSLAADGKTRALVIDRATAPRLIEGWLFYVNEEEEFLAAPFASATLKTTAPGIPQPERFDVGFNQTDYAYDVSRDGTLVYQPFEAAQRSLAIVEPGGQTTRIPGPPRAFEAPRVSPDGEKIAVTIRPRTNWGDVWIGDVSGTFLPLTRDGKNRSPVWSPASDQLAVESNRDGTVSSVFMHSIDGKTVRRLEVAEAAYGYPVSWLADNSIVIGAYNIPNKPRTEELRLIKPPQTTADRIPLAVAATAYGRVSPDGKWLAYTTSESGQWEIYLTAFPAPQRMWPISKAGSGREPVWAKSSPQLFFLRDDGSVMSVSIGPDGQVGDPRPAGVGQFPRSLVGPGNPYWDTMPDGRFVVTQTIASAAVMPIAVVVNRFAGLAAK